MGKKKREREDETDRGYVLHALRVYWVLQTLLTCGTTGRMIFTVILPSKPTRRDSIRHTHPGVVFFPWL